VTAHARTFADEGRIVETGGELRIISPSLGPLSAHCRTNIKLAQCPGNHLIGPNRS